MKVERVPAAPLSIADRSFLDAVSAWGDGDLDRVARRLSPAWRDRLSAGEGGLADPTASSEGLRAEHSAAARVDLDRVHPSWIVRALQGETPAVRRVVAAPFRGEIAEAVRTGLKIDAADLDTDRTPHPEAVRQALSLWSERLVGGPPPGPEDAPVIEAVAGLTDSAERARLCARIGLAKWAYALGGAEPPAEFASRPPLRPTDLLRRDAYRELWGERDPQLVRLAIADLRSVEADLRFSARLGLVTLGRLLAGAEPTRVRWLLQHLPYDAAKTVRSRMGPASPTIPRRTVLAWETRVLEMARTSHAEESAEAGGPE